MEQRLLAKLVRDYEVDVIHLDQATSHSNDVRHNRWRGVWALCQELRRRLPTARRLFPGRVTPRSVAHLYPL